MKWGFPTRESPLDLQSASCEAPWWKAKPAQIHLPCASLLPQRRASLLLSAVSLPPLLASCDFLVFAALVPQKLISVFQENGILFWPQFHHPMKTNLLPKGQLLLTKTLDLFLYKTYHDEWQTLSFLERSAIFFISYSFIIFMIKPLIPLLFVQVLRILYFSRCFVRFGRHHCYKQWVISFLFVRKTISIHTLSKNVGDRVLHLHKWWITLLSRLWRTKKKITAKYIFLWTHCAWLTKLTEIHWWLSQEAFCILEDRINIPYPIK